MSETATQTEIELQPRMATTRDPECLTTPQPTTSPSEPEPEPDPKQTPKLLTSAFSFFVAGTNDGSIGALLPYILSTYHIGPSFITLLYITTFLGWLVAAFTNTYLTSRLPIGTLLILGSVLQIIPQVIRVCNPNFGAFAVSFFLVALGQAYQDANANAFVSLVKGGVAHRWLGFVHAMYGAGMLVSPFVATAAAVSGRWELFYLFPLGLGVVNILAVCISFWDSVGITKPRVEEEGQGVEGKGQIGQILRSKHLWVFCLFFFFYLGVATTSGGWIVEYLVNVRGGDLEKVGYVPAGSYGGIFLGRLLLAEPAHRYGERLMLSLHAVACLVLQLTFWLVPNLISSVVMFSIMGFFLGPSFAAGVSVASKTLPKEIQAASLGMIFVMAQAGAAIFPSLIGLIASKSGVQVLPPIVVGLIVAMGVTWAFVPKVPAEHED